MGHPPEVDTCVTNRMETMDHQLEADTSRKLERLTEHPDLDLHLRIQEHRLEGYAWSDGRRFRIIGVRDEEDPPDSTEGRNGSEPPP
jgi:hypothetical protein